MGTQNFHPKNVILLDGYWLVDKVFPKVDLFDYAECKKYLDLIMDKVVFDPWVMFGSVKNPGYWLTLKKKNGQESDIFNILKVDGEHFAFNALLPNGQLLKIFRKVGLKSTFYQEDIYYAEFDDGSFIQVTPSLNTKFLELHQQKSSVAVVEEPTEKKIKYKSEGYEFWVDDSGIVVTTRNHERV